MKIIKKYKNCGSYSKNYSKIMKIVVVVWPDRPQIYYYIFLDPAIVKPKKFPPIFREGKILLGNNYSVANYVLITLLLVKLSLT